MAALEVGQALLYPALRKAGVTLAPGRGPSPAQFADALGEVNRLLGSLSIDRYFVYTQDILTLPLESGKTTYTIGIDPSGALPAADFLIAAPKEITYANYISGAQREPLSVLTPQQWASISNQDVAATLMYYDHGYPIAKIYLCGQPAGGQLELYVWHVIPAIAATADVVVLAPEYEDVIVLNLACRLAPQFGRPVDPDVRQQARESLMHLRSINAPQPIADLSWGPGGWGDYGGGGALIIGGGGGGGEVGPPGPPGPQGPPGPGAAATFGLTIDGAAATVTTGVKGYISIPFAATITGWDIVADQAGSITIAVAKKAGAPPNTTTDTISSGSPIALSAAQIVQNGPISGWTTAVAPGDVIGFNVTSASTVTRVTVTVRMTKV